MRDCGNLRKAGGTAALICSAVLFGFTFVFQKTAAEHLGAAAVTTLRFAIGAAALAAVIAVNDAIKLLRRRPRTSFGARAVTGGILSGAALLAATLAQQTGLEYTTAGKAGFITALYIVFVPLIALVGGRRTAKSVWFACLVALAGFSLIASSDSAGLNKGDLYILLSSLCYAVQVLLIDEYASGEDPFKFSFVQFCVVALAGLPFAAAEGMPDVPSLGAALPSLLYMGLAASGAGYTLQVLGQQYVKPASATVILSAESVVALIGGVLVLHESGNVYETSGCVLALTGVCLAQAEFAHVFLPFPRIPAEKKSA